VIEQLEAEVDSAEVSEKTAQLREISRTVERLAKAGVPVPDVVRSEKLRLASLLGVKSDATQALAQLAGEFAELYLELQVHLPKDVAKSWQQAEGD
jgi:hypothetical protein